MSSSNETPEECSEGSPMQIVILSDSETVTVTKEILPSSQKDSFPKCLL